MSKYYRLIIAMLVIVIILLLTCNKRKPDVQQPVNTIVKTDTVIVKESFDIPVYVPQPYAVIRDKVVYRNKIDTLIEYVESDDIVKDWRDAHLYADTQATKYGQLIINDTITKNRIAGRSIKTNFSIPVITNTVTSTITEPRRVKGFAVATLQGTSINPLSAFGGGFMLQFKNDNAVELQAIFHKLALPNWPTQQFQLSYKQKISFTKK